MVLFLVQKNVTIDRDIAEQPYHSAARLNWQPVSDVLNSDTEKRMIDYFILMFPVPAVKRIVNATNTQLRSKGFASIDAEDLYKYIGLRYLMALCPIPGTRRRYWEKRNDETESRHLIPCHDFGGKFQMTFKVFEAIDSNLRLLDYTSIELEQNPYIAIDCFVNDFNERRRKVIIPGEQLIVDECMVSWRGRDKYFDSPYAIHITKIPRKPKSMGVEFKALADGDSKILLKLEMQTGKESNQTKECDEMMISRLIVTFSYLCITVIVIDLLVVSMI